MISIIKNKLTFMALILMILNSVSVLAVNTVIVNLPSQNLDWKTTPEGVAFAALRGDRFKESYMAMVKLPAGITSPVHTKSSNMFGVVLEGTFSHMKKGDDPLTAVLLPKGSYYMIPAHLPHISKCVSKVQCVSFLYQDGKFDFITNTEK